MYNHHMCGGNIRQVILMIDGEKDASHKTKTTIMQLTIPGKSAKHYLSSGIHFDNPSHRQIG